jgi:hypothetical protein
MPASISAAVIAERNSSSVRSLNQVVIFGETAGLPGAKALRTLVSSNHQSQIALPERRGIALGLHGMGNPHQQSSKTRPVGRICPARILHRHHDGGRPAILGDCRRLTSLSRLDDGGERRLGIAQTQRSHELLLTKLGCDHM